MYADNNEIHKILENDLKKEIKIHEIQEKLNKKGYNLDLKKEEDLKTAMNMEEYIKEFEEVIALEVACVYVALNYIKENPLSIN